MQDEQLHTRQPAAVSVEPTSLPADLPQCCGTGCVVCVLDYPEHFSTQRSESETLAMLEAVEKAQQMIANQDGDSL